MAVFNNVFSNPAPSTCSTCGMRSPEKFDGYCVEQVWVYCVENASRWSCNTNLLFSLQSGPPGREDAPPREALVRLFKKWFLLWMPNPVSLNPPKKTHKILEKCFCTRYCNSEWCGFSTRTVKHISWSELFSIWAWLHGLNPSRPPWKLCLKYSLWLKTVYFLFFLIFKNHIRNSLGKTFHVVKLLRVSTCISFWKL